MICTVYFYPFIWIRKLTITCNFYYYYSASGSTFEVWWKRQSISQIPRKV